MKDIQKHLTEKELELMLNVREEIEEFLSSIDEDDLILLSPDVKNLILIYGMFSTIKNNIIKKLYDKIQTINEEVK